MARRSSDSLRWTTPGAGARGGPDRRVAAAMNHLDLWVRRGLPIKITMPHIGGSDIAGVVDSVGPGVQGVSNGHQGGGGPLPGLRLVRWVSLRDRIFRPEIRLIGEHTQGGFAEFCVVPAENLVEIPEHVSFENAAAASLVGVTAWRALMVRGGLRAGETGPGNRGLRWGVHHGHSDGPTGRGRRVCGDQWP